MQISGVQPASVLCMRSSGLYIQRAGLPAGAITAWLKSSPAVDGLRVQQELEREQAENKRWAICA